MSGMGFNSWPDRQCFKPKVRRTLFIEFKRLGEKPTKAQREVHRMLRRMGQRVVVCDNLLDAIREYSCHSD